MDIVVDAPPDRQLLSETVRHAIRPRMRRLRILGAVLVVVGGLLALLGASATGESETIVMGVTFMVMGILINLLLPRRVVRLTMRLTDKIPELRQHRRLRITDGGLRSVSPLVDASYAWAAFTGVEEIPGALLLRVGQGFVVVPTRQMSPDQVLQVRMCVASQASHPGRTPATPGWAPEPEPRW